MKNNISKTKAWDTKEWKKEREKGSV